MASGLRNGILLAAVLVWLGGPVFACTTSDECDDGVACTEDTCQTAGSMSGQLECVHTPRNVECFDGDACTVDTCTATGCTHPPTDCSDNSSCTVDTCDRVLGCRHTVDCDDGIACTRDFCDNAGNMSGELACFHTPEPDQCDDGDACTVDTCSGFSGCSHAPRECGDTSSCTRDTCNPQVGCVHTLDCDDGVACTNDFCGNAGNMSGDVECKHEPQNVECFDGNACTTDICTTGGCTHGTTDCSDNSSCTVDTCDRVLGCRHTVDCDDGVSCTRDFCDNAGNMSGTLACFHTPEPDQCDDGDACTTDTCGQSGCRHDPIDCDDADACTDDTCAAGVCDHAPVDCDDGDRCTMDACAEGQCTCEIDPACAAQGCTPGYWKTNSQKKKSNAWPSGYTPSMKVQDVFAVPSCVGGGIKNASLLQALGFSSGTSLNGSAQRLVRAGVAAVLNAASSCVQYPMCLDEVIARVDAALASCDRRTIVALASFLEGQNELGCPLDQRGACENR